MIPLRMALCFGLVDPVGEGYSRRRQQTGGFPQTPLSIQLRQSTFLTSHRRSAPRHLTVKQLQLFCFISYRLNSLLTDQCAYKSESLYMTKYISFCWANLKRHLIYMNGSFKSSSWYNWISPSSLYCIHMGTDTWKIMLMNHDYFYVPYPQQVFLPYLVLPLGSAGYNQLNLLLLLLCNSKESLLSIQNHYLVHLKVQQ